MTLQQLVEIAARHATAMADAMVRACVAKALETGEPLRVPVRRARPGARHATATAEVDWERMVRGNSDTRRMHC